LSCCPANKIQNNAGVQLVFGTGFLLSFAKAAICPETLRHGPKQVFKKDCWSMLIGIGKG
jgi:hypothetical protein